jgi:cytoskeletal protein CcmA (bactofilin family)
MSIEQRYTAFETAKNYTKQYELDAIDSIVTKQEDGMLGYVSAGQFATTGSNIFEGGQIIDGNITVTGDIYAANFVTSSTLLFTGSTNHGSHIEDVHTYTGSVRITGSLSVIGGINGQINATNGVVSSSAQIKNYGDFATTGSNSFNGIQTITGSFLVSGSTIQIGNNTLDGNTILSGSISVSGSQLFKGTQTLSGSFLLSGSTFQQGNNTLIGDNTITGSNSLLGNNTINGNNLITGNTIMSGSLEISGSQTRYGVTKNVGTWELTGSMFTSGSTVITGNTTIGGNLDLSGSIRVSGSFTGSMQFNGDLNLQSPHSFYRWGNKLFNYGAFYNTLTQSGSLNVSQSIQFNSTDYSEGVSMVSGSRITLENIGVYNIQFSAQLVDAGPGDSTIHLWIKKNGQNVPNSAGRIFLQSNKETVAAWNYVVPATSANDYYELMWQSTDADARILAAAATGNIPAIPSIILTVTQVA